MDNPGSRRLILAASAKAAAVRRGVPLPEWHAERLRRANRENNVARNLVLGYHGPWWSQHELALLGKLDDDEVARRTGRTPNAVRVKQQKLAILNPTSRPGGAMRVDRRFLVLVLVLSAVWWFITLAWRWDGGRPRPAELIPASAPR
jgi:hypothetical protein